MDFSKDSAFTHKIIASLEVGKIKGASSRFSGERACNIVYGGVQNKLKNGISARIVVHTRVFSTKWVWFCTLPSTRLDAPLVKCRHCMVGIP